MDDLDRLIPIEWHDVLDSTSRQARREVESGAAGDQPLLIVARRQSAGIGRLGRRWESPEGGLWCTLIWPARGESGLALEGLGLRVGLAVARCVERALERAGSAEPVMLKWPNDAMVRGKKIAGCLVEVMERAGRTYALVGVGINANFAADALPGALRDSATTMLDVAGRQTPLTDLARELRAALRDALMAEGLDRATLDEAQRRTGAGEHRGRQSGAEEGGAVW